MLLCYSQLKAIKVISVRKSLECPKSIGVVVIQQQSVPRGHLGLEEHQPFCKQSYLIKTLQKGSLKTTPHFLILIFKTQVSIYPSVFTFFAHFLFSKLGIQFKDTTSYYVWFCLFGSYNQNISL